MGFMTDAVHAGQHPEETTGAVIVPIFQTATYAQEAPAVHKGYEYGRTGNPTRLALEKNLAALERGRFAHAFSSGMAATSTVTKLLKAGDHVVCTANVYGGTARYFRQVMADFGLQFDFVDTSSLEQVAQVWRRETKMLFVESPTNPLLILSDLRALADFCHERKALLVVDNTFLSPYFQRPLELGADLVVHSTTKFINGHSDVIGGVVVTSNAAVAERLAFLQNAVGAVPSPFDCWLILRSTKTLPLRMRQSNANAMAIANFLAADPRVVKVYYPGLASHPQHELAKRQQLDPYGQPGFGGMISFELADFDTAKTFLKGIKLFTLAESLGGVESLICHPTSMTHASVPPEMRQRIGLRDGLVRLSVGIEDAEDLIADLQRGLQLIS
ncbi:MAG: PLP-dependent aspartate aminotransferase family protein [candidate division KSB1 bacterium]|nr:PLP-dependent aspartate aminotransferase family protein [candidate division KSB1 bacterium]MDZ7273130.1 PLP-dependent aspartate aminotransferase family protein [candidate division KSB1 bacterium]MDZ7285232.1 PLP-dependent aspartate aminotransferase family protein [candidate division KSB1 bacterium]MDZ7298264.1 PLP-dependent aspartate aminotransferase family protein [candidate division KSB1 bacterium]MDZ7308985.1 PLP-dependent aspartate aminotransferase family protein [candidate division KSB1